MTLLWKLAPFADNYDMWIAIAFCYLPIIPLLIIAYISSKSGSLIRERIPNTTGVRWIKSDKNIPFIKNSWFHFAIIWLILGSLFFWTMLWPNYHDVWFILDK